jgi:hypothetical protein
MDATAVTTSTKAFDTLRAFPTWLLTAIGLAGLVICTIPSFLATVPQELQPWVPLATVIVSILALCSAANSAVFQMRQRWSVAEARDRLRLIHVYRPLASLFLTRHVTSSSAVLEPRFRGRVENAWAALNSYRRRTVAVKQAFRALFDRRISTSAEVEFGGGFPLTEIVTLTRRQAKHADAKLLNLVAWADRSRYEEGTSGLLTDAELELFDHIQDEHQRLSRKFD